MTLSNATNTPINEFRPLLRDLKLASKFCPKKVEVYLRDYSEISKKYDMHNTLLRIYFTGSNEIKIPGYFIAQDEEEVLILNIVLHEDFFVDTDKIDLSEKRRNIVHRKIIGVHEFVHAIANIVARKNSLIDDKNIENQVHKDIVLRELQKSLDLPDEHSEDKNACNESIKMSNSTHFRYSDSDVAIDYGEVFKRLLLSKESIREYSDFENIISLVKSGQNKEAGERTIKSITDISEYKYVNTDLAKDRLLEELTRELIFSV